MDVDANDAAAGTEGGGSDRTRRAFARSLRTTFKRAATWLKSVVRKIGSWFTSAIRAALRSAAACDFAAAGASLGTYRTKPRGMVRRSSRARMRAATSSSDRAFCIVVAMLRGRRLRLRGAWDLPRLMDADELEEVDEEDEDILDEERHARAHRDIACSTPAEIAPRRRPKTDAFELELDEEAEGTGEGVLGGPEEGGVPR